MSDSSSHAAPVQASAPASPSALRAVAARLVAAWHEEFARRQTVSRNDPTADVFAFCATKLDEALKAASALDEPLSPAEYGALEHIQATASTVRRWCVAGDIECVRVGRDWRIRRGATPPAHHTKRRAA